MSVHCPTLTTSVDYVGRPEEMAELRHYITRAAGGSGRLVLLVGEPGIGKTRTCEELAAEAQAIGMRVLWGRCWEAGGEPVYWPWTQVLDALSAPPSGNSSVGAAGSAALPSFEDGQAPLRERLARHSLRDRFQLFQNVMALIRATAESTPLLILLDDLQGADEPSLLLLEFVARHLATAPVAVVGTYREVGLTTGSPLAARLPELTREPATSRMTLRPLNAEEVEAFVNRVASKSVAPSVAASLHRLTDGNPLFLIESLRALSLEDGLDDLANGRAPLPAGIRDAVRRHLAPLSAECRAVLRAAAVFGRDLSIVTLRHLLRYGDDLLLTALLDEAVETDILTVDPTVSGRYRFVHVLVRDVLYAEMTCVEQLRCHHDAAMLLSSRLGVEANLAQIAHHFTEAARRGADPEHAVLWGQRAGERALGSFAYAEAERLYAQALDILEHFGPDDHRRHAELLLAHGNALNRLGKIGPAKQTFERAAELARALDSRELLAEAALGYGGPLSFPAGGDVDHAYIAFVEEALSGWGDTAHPLHARLLGRLAAALYFSDEPERRRELSIRALEMARAVGDNKSLGQVLLAAHTALWGPNPGERLEFANELVRLVRRTGNRALGFAAHHGRYCDLLELDDVAGMENEFQACRALAAELREPAMVGWIDLLAAGRAMWEGRFEESERLATENAGLARWLGKATQTPHFLQMFHLRALQGRADEMLEKMRTVAALNPGMPVFSVGLAYIHIDAGRLDEARPLATGMVAHLDRYPRDINYVSTLTCLGLVCARLGDAALTAPVYELMRPYETQSVMIGTGFGYCGSVAHWLGVMAASLGRLDDATAHFERALVSQTRMGSPPWMANTQYEYAAMLIGKAEGSEQGHGAALLEQAIETSERLGMAALNARARSLASSSAAVPLPARSAETLSTQNGAGISLFRREGDFWTIGHDGHTLRMRDSRGLRYLARLLQHPHREFLVVELAADETPAEPTPATRERSTNGNGYGCGADSVADRKALAQYKSRLEEVRSELLEAEANNDTGRASLRREEMEALVGQLASAVGLGGRQRPMSSDLERARSAVSKRIHETLRRILRDDPQLGRHLTQNVQTGYFCTYAPPSHDPIRWSF